MKILKYILCGVVALLMEGCMSEVTSPGEPSPSPVDRPTVPLKRRPIVPTTKLPRPRVAEVWQSAEGVTVVLASDVQCAVVTVEECATGAVNTYVVDGGALELGDLSVGEFEIVVELDDATSIYRVEEWCDCE